MKPEEFQMLAGNLENTTPQSSEKITSVARVRSPITRFIFFAVLVTSLTQQAMAAAEDFLAGAFDKVTGVPFASTMLGVVRSGEQSSQSPAVLDSRLAAVEALLKDIDPRLRLVESRLKQLQSEVIKVSNINRLRELQRIRTELAEINAELKTKPTDPGRRAILEFRARQQADLIKNNVDFDIWKMSDITTDDQTVRTRFFVYPSFELYAIAITTWFAAIEMNSGDQPQRIVNESGSFLLDHATFLQTRSTWREFVDEPLTLEEHLRTAAFCRLEAVTKFSDASGDCVFASVCVDTMADKSVETDRQTLAMQPSKAGILCTFNPGQAQGLKDEDELRASYGAELMVALAKDLDRLAHTGSLREPFVGTFPNFINAQIFSVPLDGPVLAPIGAASGTFPAIPKCTPVVGGCSFGVKLSEQTGWKITNTNGGLSIRHNGSGLCLDVKNSVAVSGASAILFSCNDTISQIWNEHMVTNRQFTLESNKSGMCVTVEPAADPKKVLQLRRSLLLQKCDQRELQKFSHLDSTFVGPK